MAEVPEEKRVPLTEGGRDLHRGHREERRALRAFAQAPAAGHRHRPGAVARVRAGRGRGCSPAFPGAEDSPAPPLLCGSVGETLVRNRSDGPGRAPAPPRAPWTCWNLPAPAPEPASGAGASPTLLGGPHPWKQGRSPGGKPVHVRPPTSAPVLGRARRTVGSDLAAPLPPLNTAHVPPAPSRDGPACGCTTGCAGLALAPPGGRVAWGR